MKIKKIFNGLLALIIAGGVLLISDLNNRNKERKAPNDYAITKSLKAQEGRNYKMGLTYIAPDPAMDMALESLFAKLEEYGFKRDSNLTVKAQHANGEIANLQPLHFNMDNLDIDMILVTTTPGISAAVASVKNHPMVFTLTYTPLEAGAGKSYTDHRPNITGVGSFPPVEKTIDFIKETIPATKRIGTIYNSSEANSVKVMQVGRDYMKTKEIELVENTIINSNEAHQAILSLCSQNIDAVWITGDNTAIQAFPTIGKICADNGIPLIINDEDFVKYGALAAVGVSWSKTGERTAPYVARVLNGENPANIPIENFVEEVIVLNHDQAQKLDITFPSKYLNQNRINTKGKKLKFCLAHYVDSPNSEDAEEGIKHQLKELGLTENEHYILKTYNAQGDISTLNSITETVAADQWDIIFTTSTPTIQAMSKKIKDQPIVFTNVGDPIRAGLGNSFHDHLSHCTGISTMSDFDGLIQLVLETSPEIKTIGTIFTPGEINSVAYNDRLKIAAKNRGLKLISVPANSATEVSDAALSICNQGIEAFTQISDNLTASCGASIIKAAYNNKIPYYGFITKQVDQGAVAAVARDYFYAGVDAVNMAAEILSGKSPKEIPYRFVTQSSYTVNTDAMKYFNVTIPNKYINKTE